jgi:hypothetical protein
MKIQGDSGGKSDRISRSRSHLVDPIASASALLLHLPWYAKFGAALYKMSRRKECLGKIGDKITLRGLSRKLGTCKDAALTSWRGCKLSALSVD